MTNKEITAYEEMEKRHADGWGSANEKVYKGGDDFFYRWWKIYPEMPEGYYEDKNTGSPLSHTVFIINGSPLRGGKIALLYVKQLHSCSHNYNYKILFDHTAVSVCSKCKKRVKA